MAGVDLAEHPAVRAWERFAGTRSIPTAVEPLEKPSGKRDRHRPVFRLTGVDTRHSTLIAKRCKRVQAERELFIYREILPQLPLESPQALGCVGGERGKNDTWFFMEEVTGDRYDPSLGRHRRLAGTWLGILHTSAVHAERAAELPDQGPDHFSDLLSTIRCTLDEVETNDALETDDLAELQKICRQCELLSAEWQGIEQYCATFSPTMVQGDFKEPHIRVRETVRHQLVLFDWGDAGWGVPAVDLAKCVGYSVAPDIGTYLATVEPIWRQFDAPTVRRLGYVGEVFRWIATVRWHVEDLRFEWVERPMSRMRLYRQWMEEIIGLAPWQDSVRFDDENWQPAIRTWY